MDDEPGTLGPAHPSSDVVLLDGTGVRAGRAKNGCGAYLASGLTGRSGPAGRRRAGSHLLGLTVGEDWSVLGAQLEHLKALKLVMLDGEVSITTLAERLFMLAAASPHRRAEDTGAVVPARIAADLAPRTTT